ncbi:MAG: SPFH domain-containing protein, partial [Planctomycetota bacterium]
MDQAQQLGIALGLGVVGIFLLIAFVKANVVLCQPNELVVIAGRRRKVGKGEERGYRVMRGGRGFKWPLLESVARLSLNSQSVDLQIDRATCLGMIPVMIDVRATVKLAGSSADGMDDAIERFLGRGPDAVSKAAKQALEGALRGVIATMSPEDANANRLELAAQAAEKARADLRRLGIVLDFLQIQGIWDEQDYLKAIARKENAAVQRDA